MKLIKACFLSYVSLLQGLHAKERALLFTALAAWHEAFDIGTHLSPFQQMYISGRQVMLPAKERSFYWQLEMSGSLAFGTATWQVSLLCISCWMIHRVF